MNENEQTEFEIVTQNVSPIPLGIRMGTITALVYVVLLLIRYVFLSYNPVVFTGGMLVSYLIVIAFYIITANQRRKEIGGYGELRDIFGSVFIVIIFSEVIYTVFNFIYLNYIDPDFFSHYMQHTLEFLKKTGGDSAKVTHQIDKFKNQKTGAASVSNTLVGLAIWLVIDSIIGLLISLAFKKSKPQY